MRFVLIEQSRGAKDLKFQPGGPFWLWCECGWQGWQLGTGWWLRGQSGQARSHHATAALIPSCGAGQGSWGSSPDTAGFLLFSPQGDNHTNPSMVFTLV